jgi:hypothetical protein
VVIQSKLFLSVVKKIIEGYNDFHSDKTTIETYMLGIKDMKIIPVEKTDYWGLCGIEEYI